MLGWFTPTKRKEPNKWDVVKVRKASLKPNQATNVAPVQYE